MHCKIAKLDSAGNFIEKARIIRVGLKKFETVVKENLETMGYTVEILYHPMGKYSNVVIKDKDVEIRMKDAEINALKAKLESDESEKIIADKDAEIARLQRELEKAHKAKSEDATAEGDNAVAEGTKEKKNKVGRPSSKEA